MKLCSASCSVLLATVLAACGPAQSPANARATARAAVSVAKIAYVAVGNACMDLLEKDPMAALKCGTDLDPAYALILGAGQAVDTSWSPKAACDLVQGIAITAAAAKDLGAGSADVQVVIDDAAVLAKGVLGSAYCASVGDAGAADAGGQ